MHTRALVVQSAANAIPCIYEWDYFHISVAALAEIRSR